MTSAGRRHRCPVLPWRVATELSQASAEFRGCLTTAGSIAQAVRTTERSPQEVIALVGGDTLLGREIREVAGESSLGDHLRLVAAEGEEAGRLTIVGQEPAVVAKLDPDALEGARVLVLAGTPESSKEALKMAPDAQ